LRLVDDGDDLLDLRLGIAQRRQGAGGLYGGATPRPVFLSCQGGTGRADPENTIKDFAASLKVNQTTIYRALGLGAAGKPCGGCAGRRSTPGLLIGTAEPGGPAPAATGGTGGRTPRLPRAG